VTEPGLSALLETAGVRRGVRVLLLGRMSANARRQLDPVLAAHAASVIAIDDGDPFNAPLPGGIGLCVVTLPVARMPDVFEELIYDQLADVLAARGILLIQFSRDASDAALDALKVSHPQTRMVLQEFSHAHFGTLTLNEPSPLIRRFANDGAYEFFGWASRSQRPATGEPVVWLVLRRKADAGQARGFERTDRSDRYPLRHVQALMRELIGAGISLVSVDRFAQDGVAAGKPCGLLKFDLHRQIHRPIEVAHMLTDAHVSALFLMMPRHPFNEAFFDEASTWHTLDAIRGGGHEIGLHLDVFHLIRAFGDLYAGTEAAVADFRKRGFDIRAATLHGDTRRHIVERGMVREDFFEEDAARSAWDGRPPLGEETLADHVRRYSYRTLAERCGIRYLAEERFRMDGRLVREKPLVYLSDNSRSIAVRNIPAGEGTTSLTAPRPFRIEAEFSRNVARTLSVHPFLALLHPQWIW
jgi:hypothetical protein